MWSHTFTLAKAAAPGNTSLRPNLAWKHWHTKLETSGLGHVRKGQLQWNWLKDTYWLLSSFHHYNYNFYFCIHWQPGSILDLLFFQRGHHTQGSRAAHTVGQMPQPNGCQKRVVAVCELCTDNFHETIINPQSTRNQIISNLYRSIILAKNWTLWICSRLRWLDIAKRPWPGQSAPAHVGPPREGHGRTWKDWTWQTIAWQHMVKLWSQSNLWRIYFQSEVCASLTFWH